MDELVFANLQWPKVTLYQERWDTAGWALFTETCPPGVETTNHCQIGNDSWSRPFPLYGERFRSKWCWDTAGRNRCLKIL